MGKQRKLSDLTNEETATVVDLLKRFQFELDEDGEDEKEVIQALQTAVRKFNEVKFQTEAGCRIMINEVMLYATTNLETSRSGVAIAPKFRISQTTLDFGGSSYGGVVDYLTGLARQ